MDACACFFFVLGLGAHATNFDHNGRAPFGLENPLGVVEAGYQFRNGIEVKAAHTSQVFVRDTGLNLFIVQKRWNFKPR